MTSDSNIVRIKREINRLLIFSFIPAMKKLQDVFFMEESVPPPALAEGELQIQNDSEIKTSV